MTHGPEPAWHGGGIAEPLMRRVLGWVEDAGVSSVVRHASDTGRALYNQLGFDRWTREKIYHGAPVTLARVTR